MSTIAIDIDGTLIQYGKLNKKLADWAGEKKAEGHEVNLWSARGKNYAIEVAKKYKLVNNFTAILGKPNYIVDDKGWSWVKKTQRLTNLI